jgi:hypothetical protein
MLLPEVERAMVSFVEPECCAAGACIGPRLHLPDASPDIPRKAEKMRRSWHDAVLRPRCVLWLGLRGLQIVAGASHNIPQLEGALAHLPCSRLARGRRAVVRRCHDGRAGRELSHQTCVTFAPSHDTRSRRFDMPTSASPPAARGPSHPSVGEQRGQSDRRPRHRLG